MQNKLLLRINHIINRKDKPMHLDSAVELMQTLIERSKQDRDLLVAAKGSVDFYISDLVSLEKEVEKKIHSMHYLHKIFEHQIDSLKELDFPDFKEMGWNKETKKRINAIAKKLKAKVFTAECLNDNFKQKAGQHFNAKSRQNDLFLETKQLLKFLNFVENNSALQRNPVNLFVGGIKIKIDYPHVYVTAPYKQLQQVLEK